MKLVRDSLFSLIINKDCNIIEIPLDDINIINKVIAKVEPDAYLDIKNNENEKHEHHEHHDGHCSCGHDHHDYHADEVFTSWGVETHKKFTVSAIKEILEVLDSGSMGIILRAKGIVACEDGGWIHFDFVPGEINVRMGAADVTGKLCVIGSDLNESGVANLFGV